MPSGSLTNYAIKENVILYSEVEKNLDLEFKYGFTKYLYQWGT